MQPLGVEVGAVGCENDTIFTPYFGFITPNDLMRLNKENQRQKHNDCSNAEKVVPPKVHCSILMKKEMNGIVRAK